MPSGKSSPTQINSQIVHTIVKVIEYGIINDRMVPMPACGRYFWMTARMMKSARALGRESPDLTTPLSLIDNEATVHDRPDRFVRNPPIPAVIRRVGAARLASVFVAFAVLCIGLFSLSVVSHADDPPTTETVPNERDFDDDSVKDEVLAQPSEEEVGTVEVQSGSSGSTMTRYEGRAGGDGFGEAAAIIGDVDWDGVPDILVGAPRDGTGVAYVMPGEVTACPVRVEHALYELHPIGDDYEFGFAVAPLYDYDGDGTIDFRVAAKFLDAEENINYRTYIFAAGTGDLLATVSGTGAFAALTRLEGDSDYDADVDQDDMDRVVANLGRSGNLTRYDGDVNDDSHVDGLDVALVTSKQGFLAYATTTTPNLCNEPNCVSISSEASQYCLCTADPAELQEAARIEYQAGVSTSGVVIIPVPGPCGDQIAACLNDYRVLAALELIDARCYGVGGDAPSLLAKIYCKTCGETGNNETQMESLNNRATSER